MWVQGRRSACMGGTGRRLGENLQCFYAGYCMGQAASVLQPQIDMSENVLSLADANLRGVSEVASSVATSGGSGGGNPCPAATTTHVSPVLSVQPRCFVRFSEVRSCQKRGAVGRWRRGPEATIPKILFKSPSSLLNFLGHVGTYCIITSGELTTSARTGGWGGPH